MDFTSIRDREQFALPEKEIKHGQILILIWTQSYKYLGYGHDTDFPIARFSANPLPGTSLFFLDFSGGWESNVCYLMFFGVDSEWSTGGNYKNISENASKYSGTSNYSFDNTNSFYYVALKSANNAVADIAYLGTNGSTLLNKNITIIACLSTDNGVSYSQHNWQGGTITANRYFMVNGTNNNTSHETSTALTSSSNTTSAVRTSNITFTAQNNRK